jgi:hypothetical protein
VSGRAWFIYDLRFIGKPPFWYEHFPNTASKYAATLLLVPPLLVSGLWPYWRRRELGPLFLICGLIALMSFYFFVDRGRTTVETLIMSPRLILPAVAFLLIGYADNLAALVAWARGGRPALAAPVVALLVAVPLAVALPISVRHRHWQQESAAALAIASRLAAENSDHRLGVDEGTIKAGLLYPGPVTIATLDPAPPPVVACSDTSISYRSPVRRRGCVLPGYHESAAIGAFGVLTRGTSK